MRAADSLDIVLVKSFRTSLEVSGSRDVAIPRIAALIPSSLQLAYSLLSKLSQT